MKRFLERFRRKAARGPIVHRVRCPECGREYPWEAAHPHCPTGCHLERHDAQLGSMFSVPVAPGQPRWWCLTAFSRYGAQDREVLVVGDRSGPRAASFPTVLALAGRLDEIEQRITGHVRGDRATFPYGPDLDDIHAFLLYFHDVDDSSHYRAHLFYTLPAGAPFRPFTHGLGNGEWELALEMRGIDVVAVFPEGAR